MGLIVNPDRDPETHVPPHPSPKVEELAQRIRVEMVPMARDASP
ncbi:hypothetical protein [Thermasporomyces composti]|nr:hypothetical protein [Thermasporomyces composti]